MKFFLTTSSILTLLISSYGYGQAIDTSLLENLSPEQLELAKSELVKSTIITEGDVKPVIESTKKVDLDVDVIDFENKKFGYNYFQTAPSTISAIGDLPLPNDYKISLNDQFTFILSGSKESIFDLNVNLDGTILFPELGSISVAGETFQDIKNKIRNLIQQSYIGVQVDLSLKNLSAKKITIVGAVNNPGTYLVNPFSTISSALSYSGGISEIGTLRNIRLIRSDGKKFNFDLYRLLINGDRSDDITIESGDVIIIGAADHFITLSGEVKRPAIYEIKRNETLKDLIAFGLGFAQMANESNINLSVLDNKSSIIKSKIVDNLDSDLANVLTVNVNPYINKNIASISVAGAVKEPGLYEIGNNDLLSEFINELEFVDVYPWLAVLMQFDEDNLVKTSTLFSLKDPNTYKSIKLIPNSKLFFANINTRKFEVDTLTEGLIKDYELKINHKQGGFNLPVFGKYSVLSLIDLLGLDMSDVENTATYISPLEDIVLADDYRKMQFTAAKYNTINFRSPVNDLISVTITGAIDYPGTYVLQSNTTIQDLYNLVGNFKLEAFFDGIIFTKEVIKERQIESINKSKEDLNKALLVSTQKGENIGDVSIIRALSETIEPKYLGRIAGDYSPGSISSKNTILSDGDKIIIPRNPYTVNVLGEVLNPIAFEYKKNISVETAIANAGGYQDYADKRKVYIIKANGMIERTSRNIFVRNVNVEPGDTIIVPRKIITNNPGLDALMPITKILSDLAFSAAALESLSNSN
jgi:polysaccharide biosynthesis/export protein